MVESMHRTTKSVYWLTMSNTKPTCWTLTNGAASLIKQTAGIANALGLSHQHKTIRVRSPWRYLPKSIYIGALHTQTDDSDPCNPPWPDYVISCNKYTVPTALAIRHQSGHRTKLIHVMRPPIASHHFDAVVAPEHDHVSGSNVIQTLGVTHDISTAALTAARQRFESQFAHLKPPYMAIFLGGSTRRYTLTPARMQTLIQILQTLSEHYPGSLLISGSRRTGADNVALLAQAFQDHSQIYVYPNTGENPYLGMLALAETIVISLDSINMISEACFTGKPVYLLRLPEQPDRRSHQPFIQTCMQRGYVRPYTGQLDHWVYEPLDECQRITPLIKAVLSR